MIKVHQKRHPGKPITVPPKVHFLSGLVCVLTSLVGGSIIINGFLTPNPQPFLQNLYQIPLVILIWSLTLYTPFGLFRTIFNNPLVEWLLYPIDGIYAGSTLMRTIDNALANHPNSFFAVIILGVLSICGGSLLRPYVLNVFFVKKNPYSPYKLTNPFTRPFILTLLYYLFKMKEIRITVATNDEKMNFELNYEMVILIISAVIYFDKFFMKYSATNTPIRKPTTPASVDEKTKLEITTPDSST